MAKRHRRVNARFFLILGGLAVLLLIVTIVVLSGGGGDTIEFGSVETSIQSAGVIIRDETIVSTEKYEKINFNVIEGQAVADQTLIATVFKRGYQDESMIALLNLQKEILSYQRRKLTGSDPTLDDLDTRITAVEALVRDTARGDSDQDVLTLEQQLKSLQSERIAYLRGAVSPDSQLQSLYNQLQDQENSMKNWTRDIVNTAGNGIVSFYFDGYEQVLSSTKLNTINVSLISSLVRGNNTTSTTESSSEQMLYRLISPNHWYFAFTTKIDSPMRLCAGEEYYVTFDDYSDAIYLATAREPIVFQKSDAESTATEGVVNILEFNVDIGSFLGIRMVNATVSKAAQGLMVDAEMVGTKDGIPCVYVESGTSVSRVQVDVLAMDEKSAVICPRNENEALVSGQKLVRP